MTTAAASASTAAGAEGTTGSGTDHQVRLPLTTHAPRGLAALRRLLASPGFRTQERKERRASAATSASLPQHAVFFPGFVCGTY